ncbi:MAG: NAD(P)H-hydrate dehydratase [Flavobacterium sp.]|nr:NAD(P)H-hydrate dehydratase [Flavobacterium sp.]
MIINKSEFLKRYCPMDQNTHKGIQGHALIIGGSYGKIGSIVLASKACLKTGCGLVTAFVPKCGYEIVQISNPEVMVLTDDNLDHISNLNIENNFQAIGIGMGMGQDKQTQSTFHNFLKSNKVPLIIDADGINILSQNIEWLNLLPDNTIITPHFKELELLIGKWESLEDKMNRVLQLSHKHNLVIVVKGAPTLVVYKDKIHENTTGNQGLATAGSGDVLSGIITSLVAQSYAPLDAAIMGVYLHGLTADIGTPKMSYQAFIASDIIENIGNAYIESIS